MGKIAIIYGSTTGNTRDASHKLQNAFAPGTSELIDVRDATAQTLSEYDAYIFAVSTWGAGDLQDDWEEFFPAFDEVDLTGKKVAIMGLGDQHNYPDTFGDAAAILADKAVERGATLVGRTKPEHYEYNATKSERDHELVGLLLDEDSQRDLTDARLKSWVDALRAEFTV